MEDDGLEQREGFSHPSSLEVPDLTDDLDVGLADEQQQTSADLLGAFEIQSELPSPNQLFSGVDVAVEQSVYDRALWDARQSLQQNADLKLPWESGIFSDIFGDGLISIPGPTDLSPAVAIPSTSSELIETVMPRAAAVTKGRQAVPIHALVSANLRDLDAVQLEDEAWETAVSKWQFIYAAVDFSGAIGGRIFKEKMSGASDDVCRQIIRDVLGIKSPKTAIKRANCSRRFLNWLVTKNCKPWPFFSGRVIAYLSDCTRKKPAATFGISLVEALKFSQHVMGIEIGLDILNDPQLAGKVKRMAVNKPEVKQARPLLCSEVKRLERFMVDSMVVEDVYIVGCCLFALFARARWSDIRYIHQASVDKSEIQGEIFGFFECTTKYHKTSTSMERKARYMPLVCPLIGLTGIDWTSIWLGAMTTLGLNIDAVPVGSLCRAINPSGGLSVRHLSTSEITAFLNQFFETTEDNRLSSHSLKETSLSWSAKFGIDEDSRTLLGHHELSSKGKSKSLATYSRDMLSRPLMFYCNMLKQIRRELFLPDLSRSGWMKSLAQCNTGQQLAGEGMKEDIITGSQGVAGGIEVTGVPQQVPAGDNGHDEEVAKSCESQEVTTEHQKAPMGDQQDESDALDDGGEGTVEEPKQPIKIDVDSSDIESASSSSSTPSESAPIEELTSGRLAIKDKPVEIPGPLFQNRKSGVLHKPGKDATIMACGLKFSAALVDLPNGSIFKWARCGKCFRGEVIASSDQAADVLEEMAKRRRRE